MTEPVVIGDEICDHLYFPIFKLFFSDWVHYSF